MKEGYPRSQPETKEAPASFPHHSMTVPLGQVYCLDRVRRLIGTLFWDGYANGSKAPHLKIAMKNRVAGQLLEIRQMRNEILRQAKAASKATIRKRGDEPL